ncbi:MAG: hypothetical protein IT479_00455 [Xanthomonadales bacterium]|nr:hypothetical protein [Xanthomonadales bacterium]
MKTLLAAMAMAAALLAPSQSAVASETGLAIIHSWAKAGKKTCFSEHYHYGSGQGATRSQAQAAAVSSWVWPTDLEYGSSWADYRLAADKRLACSRNGVAWSCDTQARPCRPF